MSTADPADAGGPPGAQPERTALAWTRTAAAHVAGTALGLRVALIEPGADGGPGTPRLTAAALLLLGLLTSLALLVWTQRRRRSMDRSWGEGHPMADAPSLLLATGAALVTAVGALVLTLS